MTERVCESIIALIFRASGVDDYTPQLCNTTHPFIDGARLRRRPFGKPRLIRVWASSMLSFCLLVWSTTLLRPALNATVRQAWGFTHGCSQVQ